MSKKVISLILAVMLTVSMAAVATVGVSASVDDNGRYVPSVSDTHRYYFYMPGYWYTNDQITSAGIYWWSGTDACSAIDGSTGESYPWPGYMAQQDESVEGVDSLYYVDCPSDVSTIIWNNYFDGGEDETAEIYTQAVQSQNILCEYYNADDSDLYDQEFFDEVEAVLDSTSADELEGFYNNFFVSEYGLAMNFDNMIYIIDPELTVENELNGKLTYCGDWYFYYGDGTYGTKITKEESEAAGTLVNLADISTEDEVTIPTSGTTASTEATTIPAADEDATSSTDAVSTSDTATTTTTDSTAVQTGASSMAIVILTVLIAGVGALYFTRKRVK